MRFFERSIYVSFCSGSDYWYREQTCCLVDNGRRCGRRAGNASYSKRIQKTVTQRKLKLYMDNSVSRKEDKDETFES